MHGKKGTFRHKESDYALQLREKQKARRFYGVQERQFRRYFRSAQRVQGHDGRDTAHHAGAPAGQRGLSPGVGRLSRAQARQLVRHGHFTLNGHNHDVPSYLVKVGDLVEVRPGSRSNGYFQDAAAATGPGAVCRPGWSWIRTA